MKAVRFTPQGKPDVPTVQEFTDPRPGKHEAVVRVKATSINPSDVENVQGLMEHKTLQRTSGPAFAGVAKADPPAWIGTEI